MGRLQIFTLCTAQSVQSYKISFYFQRQLSDSRVWFLNNVVFLHIRCHIYCYLLSCNFMHLGLGSTWSHWALLGLAKLGHGPQEWRIIYTVEKMVHVHLYRILEHKVHKIWSKMASNSIKCILNTTFETKKIVWNGFEPPPLREFPHFF